MALLGGSMPRIVCISDTHSKALPKLPPGDILVHSGDFSMTGTKKEVTKFVDWLKEQPHRLKVVIAGDHDVTLDNQTGWYDRNSRRFHYKKQDSNGIKNLITNSDLYDSYGIVYLENSGFTDPETGLRYWGSPHQPEFCNWAFANANEAAAAKIWDLIPANTHVLLTHGPPAGVLDSNMEGTSCGCTQLTKALERVRPVLHVFGHIHEAYGTAERTTGTLAVNACTCDLNYKPSQEPVVVELQSEGSSGIDGLLGDQGSGKFKVTSVSRAWG